MVHRYLQLYGTPVPSALWYIGTLDFIVHRNLQLYATQVPSALWYTGSLFVSPHFIDFFFGFVSTLASREIEEGGKRTG